MATVAGTTWGQAAGRIARVSAGWVMAALVGAACTDGTGPGGEPKLAFQRDLAGEIQIFVGDPDSVGIRRVTFAGTRNIHPAWSPDRSRIAFVSNQSPAGLYVVRVDEARDRVVDATPGDDFYPAWSPDGRRIVFESTREGSPQLYVVGADGQGLRKLTTGCARSTVPTWSRDGREIAFSCESERSIVGVAPDGSHRRVIVGAEPFIFLDAPAWSPDGSALAFVRYDAHLEVQQGEIYQVRRDGGGLKRMSRFPAGDCFTPAWSPDGKRIAASCTLPLGQGYDVLVMHADGRHARTVLSGTGNEFRPAW